jgi:hypothetical protein
VIYLLRKYFPKKSNGQESENKQSMSQPIKHNVKKSKDEKNANLIETKQD